MSGFAEQRDKVLRMVGDNPGPACEHFAIVREDVLELVAEMVLEELKAELGGTFGDLFPLDQRQAEFVSGLGRDALLSSEHIDGGNRAKRWTLRQALTARDGRIRNAKAGPTG